MEGGGKRPNNVAYDLIWNGEYYMKGNTPTIDLVFSFKDLNFYKSNEHRDIRFDLTPIQFSESNQIIINFSGYEKPIVYQYR